LNDFHAAMAREHVRDLLREAEHERSIHAARAARRSTGTYQAAMVYLGRCLVAWGWRLRVRHGAIESR